MKYKASLLKHFLTKRELVSTESDFFITPVKMVKKTQLKSNETVIAF